MQGWRKTMEDAYIAAELENSNSGNYKSMIMFNMNTLRKTN